MCQSAIDRKTVISWHLKTVKGITHCFYHQRDNEDKISPLETMPGFTRGDQYCIDASGNEDLLNEYRRCPKDNSFVLIPISDVKMVWWGYKTIKQIGK